MFETMVVVGFLLFVATVPLCGGGILAIDAWKQGERAASLAFAALSLAATLFLVGLAGTLVTDVDWTSETVDNPPSAEKGE